MTGIHAYRPQAQRSGMALCLSGGGFRATLFHLGALRRLNELGLLAEVDCFVSVSGGSIANGVLATRWEGLAADGFRTDGFDRLVAEPLESFCGRDLRTGVLFWARANPLRWPRLMGGRRSVTDFLAKAYAERLGLGVTLDSFSSPKRFVFCATNLETGANWEFEAHRGEGRMGDYRTGYAPSGAVTVAQAVAASSALPSAFPPLVLTFPGPSPFRGGSSELPEEARREVPLTDGGVYDNLGLEPVWKTSRLLLASDAGSPFTLEDDPGKGLVARLRRSFDVVSSQSQAIRKRWLINMFVGGVMQGAYWGIGSDFASYGLEGAQGYRSTERELLEKVRTDLDAFTEAEIGCLENHGYALADTACRRWLAAELPAPEVPFAWPAPALSPDHPGEVAAALRDSGGRGIVGDLWRSLLP
jgi:NTE family protein